MAFLIYGFSNSKWIFRILADFPYFAKETASFSPLILTRAPRGHFPKYPIFKSDMDFSRKKLSHQNGIIHQNMFCTMTLWIVDT
jgi:hypothetical protein